MQVGTKEGSRKLWEGTVAASWGHEGVPGSLPGRLQLFADLAVHLEGLASSLDLLQMNGGEPGGQHPKLCIPARTHSSKSMPQGNRGNFDLAQTLKF